MNTQGGVHYLGAFSILGASGTTRVSNGSTTVSGTITLNGATLNSVANTIIRSASSASFTLSGTTTGASVLGLALGNTTNNIIVIDGTGGVTIGARISGANRNLTLQGVGSGTLTLSAANTYSGTTTISAGRLLAQNNSALGTSTLVVNNGGQLQLDTGITINRPATIAGSGAGNSAGAIYVASGTATYSGNLTLGADATRIGADGQNGSTLIVSGTIDSGANAFGLAIRNRGGDNGFVELQTANTYLGDTSILIGTLRLAGGNNRLPTATNLIMGFGLAGGYKTVLDLNGRNQEVAGISLLPTTVVAGTNNFVTNSSGTLSTFTINTGSTSSTFNGALNGNLKLVKAGTNSLTFTGTGADYGTGSSFTGGVDVNAGTLILGHTNALGTGTLALNGGTIASLGSTARTFTNRVAVGGNPTFGDGTNTGALAFSGTVDLGGTSRTLTTTVSTTFSGVVTNGSIQKEGAATLALSNAASSFGTLTVNAGTASIRANTAITGLGGSAGALNLAAGTLTFNQAASGTVAIPFSGSGGFTKTGANVLTLTGNSGGYAGTTTVSQGTLVANGSLGGTLSVSSGATLMGSGTVGSTTITSGATLSPGNSPGILTASNMTWAGGGNYNWQLLNASGTPGTDWDLVNGTGSLTITGSAGNPFNFNLWTLSATGTDANGPASGFSSTSDYTWKVASFAGGITGATGTSWYTINTSATNGTSGFANSFTGGTFSLVQSGNDLNLVYTAPILGTSWDYTATGGSWNTAGNWSPATVPTGTATLSFSGGGGTSTNDITLAQVTSLTFTSTASGGYTISGNSIPLGSGGIVNNSTFTQTLSSNVTLGAAASLAANSGPLTFSGTVDNAGNTLTVTGSSNTSLGVVNGTGAFSKTGSGTATLTGAVASPNVTVGAGAVLMGGSDLLANTGTVTVSGGTLNMQSNSDTVGTFSISGGSLAGAGTLTAGTYALTGGTVNANLGTGTLNANSGAATLNGTSGAGTVNVGGGSLTTGGADKLDNNAAVTVSSGGLTLGGNDTVGSFTISGGTLGGSGQTLTAATYALGGGTVNANLGAGSGTSSAGTTTLNGAFAGNLTLAGGTVLLGAADRISGSSAVSITSGSLGLGAFNDTVGSFAITGGNLGGTGTLTAPTYALNGGTVVANLGTGTITASSGAATLSGSSAATTVNVSGGTLTLNAANRLADAAAVTVSSGGLTLGGTDTVGSYVQSGGSLGGSGTLTAATYALQGGSVAANLGGGPVTVSAGTTTLASAGRLASASNLTVSSGQLSLGGNETVSSYTQSAGSLGGSGTLTAATYALQGGSVAANLGAGAVTVSGGTTSLASAGRLASASNLTVSSGQLSLGGNETVSTYTQTAGSLGGSGTLTAATYALQGGAVNANLGAGTVNVSVGTTTLGSPGRLNSTSTVNVTGGQLSLGGNETVSAYTQSAGTLGGSGTLTANTYSISGGMLNATLGSGSVSMTGGSFTGNSGQTIANAISIGSSGFGSATTLQAWDFTGQSSPATMTATSIAAGLTTGTGNNLLTRGPDAASNGAANSFRTTGFQNNGISTANTDYFQWTVTSGSSLQLSSIDARFAGTASFFAAPGVSYQFAYSTDGTNFTLIGTTGTTTSGGGAAIPTVSLAGVSALQNVAAGTTVTFRYYASGQTTTGGWGFNSPGSGTNGLTLTGAFGSTTLASAQLGISTTGATTYSGAISVTGTAELTAATGGTATFSGAISGASGAISKTGAGIVALSGSNSFAGGAALNAGTLALGSANALGTSGTISFNGGTLQSSAANTADYSARFSNAANQQYRIDTNGQNVSGTAALTSTGGSLVKLGSGTYTLTGANTFSGTTTISAGALQVGNGGTTGSLTGPIANDAALVFNRSNASTYAGAITGAGTITKLGAGDLTLSGNSGSFAGTTTISTGTLVVTGNLGGSIAMAGGATLMGSGTVGTVAVTTGATLSPGMSPGVLTTGDITWGEGGNYNWQMYDASTGAGIGWDLVSGGALTINATSGNKFNLNLWSLSGLPNTTGSAANFSFTTSGTYTIGTFSSISGFSTDVFSIVTSAANGTGGFTGFDSAIGYFSLASTGTSINLVYTHTPPTSWSYVGTTGNWSDTANWVPADSPEGNAIITFDGPGGTANNDLQAGTGPNQLTSVTSLTFSGSAGSYTLTGNPLTLNSGGIVVNSTATQTIENGITLAAASTLNSATGNLVLQTGTLDTAGYTLTLQGSATTTLATVAGSGAIVKAGAGTAVLTGTVASPNVTVGAGAMLLGGSDILSNSGTVTVSGGTFDVQGNSDTVGAVRLTSGVIAGSGTLTAATYALSGGTVAGNLGLGTATASSGTTALDGTLAGNLTLAGGAVTLGSSDRIGDASTVTISSGSLGLGSANDTVGSFAITGGVLGGAGTLTAATYSLGGGTIAANLGAGLATSSAGSTTLNGTLAGNLTLSGGTVLLGAADRIGSTSAVTINSGSLGLGAFNDTVGSFAITGGNLGGTGTLTAGTYALNGGTVSANLGAGVISATSGAATLSGSSAAGTVTVAGGSLTTGAANLLADSAAVSISSGGLTLGGSDTVNSFSITGGTLAGTGNTLTATAGYSLNGGTITANLGTGTATSAAGSTTLNGTLGGDLVVAGGTFALGAANRIANSSAVTVSSGSFGMGTFNDTVGSLTITGGAVGGSGTLTATNYNLNGGTVSANLGAGTLTAASGSATLAGTAAATTVNVSGGSLTTGGANLLADTAAVTLSSGGLTLGGNDTVGTYSQSGGTLGGSATLTAGTYALSGGTVNANLGGGTLTAASGNTSIAGTVGATTVTISGGTLALASAGRLSNSAAVTMSTGGLTLGGNETVASYTQSGGILGGSGTITANTYSISGGTLNAAIAGSGTVAMTGGNFYATTGATVSNAISIGTVTSGSIAYGAQTNLLAWDFSTIPTGTAGQPNNYGPSPFAGTYASGVTSSGLVRGSGIGTTNSGVANAWGGNDFTVSATTAALAISNNEFATFTITGISGTAFAIDSIAAYNVRRSSTGPTTGQWQYSTDGTTFTNIGSAITWGNTTSSAGNAQSAISLSSTAALQGVTSGTVTFRVALYNATNTGGTWYLNDPAGTAGTDFALVGRTGTVTAPSTTPATAGLGIDTAGSVTYSGPVSVTGTANLFAAAGGTATFSGGISGTAGSITKTGDGTVILTGSNTYAGTTTVSAGSLIGNTTSLQGAITNNANVTFDQATIGTYAGVISGTGSLAKTGAGTVTITAPQTFTGPTTISAGALALSGSGGLASPLVKVMDGGLLDVTALTGGLLVGSSQTLAGTGTVAGNVVIGGGATVAPGNSPGILDVGSMTFAGLGNYNWQIFDLAGPAGTGWDLLSGTGALSITSGTGSGQKFNVNLWTLSALPDTTGLLAGFDMNADYAFKIAEFTGGISGFAADKFAVNTDATNGTGGFTNGLNGSFSVALGSSVAGGTANELYIVYAAVPEPSTFALAGIGLAAAAWAARRRRRVSERTDRGSPSGA